LKTAILIHGCHLEANGWKNIFWGDPQKGILGRAPKAFDLFWKEENVALIYWGTGASEKDGKKEAKYSFDYALARANQLPGFKGFDTHQIEKIFGKYSYIDTVSQNTPQEVEGAIHVCREKEIERLILVSSSTHIARCLQCAEKVRFEQGFKDLEIVAMVSDICYAGSTPADVLIVEPPHRGDRAEIPLHRTLKLAMFARKISEENAQRFNADLVSFLEKEKKKYLG